MKRYPILELCARIEGHAVLHQLLRDSCKTFQDWQGLLQQAEKNGMAPLLRKHLTESKSDCPSSIRRSLSILYKRHQKQAKVRLKVLEEILMLFQKHQLTPMLIKGAALCQTLYIDPALRPMRDIDILLDKEEVDQAQELLKSLWFIQSTAPISPEHYHLAPQSKTVDEVKVCIELHRGLYPNCPPYYPEVDFKRLLESGKKLKVGGVEVYTFGHEETLHYLYQHGFHAPLTYENYKLVNAADIIGFTEKYFGEIDWGQVKERFPQLYRALPLMHHISHWDLERVPESFISWTTDRKRILPPIPFTGWPQRRVKELEEKVSLKEVLKETFLPSSWWLKVYYGAGDSTGRLLKALCVDHPKNVLWWTHLYSHFVIQTDPASMNPQKSFLGSLRLFLTSSYNKVLGVIRKMLSL